MNIPNHISESSETSFWVKNTKFFNEDPDPGSGSWTILFLQIAARIRCDWICVSFRKMGTLAEYTVEAQANYTGNYVKEHLLLQHCCWTPPPRTPRQRTSWRPCSCLPASQPASACLNSGINKNKISKRSLFYRLSETVNGSPNRQIWAGQEIILAVIYEGGNVKSDQIKGRASVYDLGPIGALAQMHDLQLINF